MGASFTQDLRLDHGELDREHGELFRLLDRAVEAHASGQKDSVVAAVTALADLLLQHTAEENRIMDDSLFPDRARHQVAHEVFLADLQRLREELARSGPTPAVGEWLSIRIPEWLRFHIAVNDSKLAAHLARHPVASGPSSPQRAPRRGS